MDAIGNLKERIKLSPLHPLAEFLYNVYWIWFIRPKWYSQTGEDRLIAKYLPEPDGTYVDIGAGLPIRGSNTYFLYKKGWRGVVVDPISINMVQSKIFRRRDTRYRSCVGQRKSEVKFYEFIPYGYSTIQESVALNLIGSGVAKLRSCSPMQVLPASFFVPSMSPSEPTLLTIDIEGADYEALCSIDWEKTKPRVICVEEWPGEQPVSQVRNLLESHGYQLREKTELSSIYVHRTWLK